MKTIAYLYRTVLFSIILIVSACGQNTEFTLLDGGSHSENDYRGKWLLINFWAEWCAPCLEEIPELNKMALQQQQMNLQVIGISYDPLSNKELLSIVKKWNIQYAVMATDPIPRLSFSLPASLPANYIIDPDGIIVAKLMGKQTFNSLVQELNIAKSHYQQTLK